MEIREPTSGIECYIEEQVSREFAETNSKTGLTGRDTGGLATDFLE